MPPAPRADIFMTFRLYFMLVFASFWYRFWKPFWLVWRSTFGALGVRTITKMSSTIYAKNGIEKCSFRGCPSTKNPSELMSRRGVKGVRGEVILPPGGRRFGRKKSRKEEREIRGFGEGSTRPDPKGRRIFIGKPIRHLFDEFRHLLLQNFGYPIFCLIGF